MGFGVDVKVGHGVAVSVGVPVGLRVGVACGVGLGTGVQVGGRVAAGASVGVAVATGAGGDSGRVNERTTTAAIAPRTITLARPRAATMSHLCRDMEVSSQEAQRLLVGMYLASFPARFDSGRVCSHTLPGPVNLARKSPSPEKRTLATPFTVSMS